MEFTRHFGQIDQCGDDTDVMQQIDQAWMHAKRELEARCIEIPETR